MVVVTIIAIIAAVAIAVYQDIVKKSKLAADQGVVASLRSAVAIYYGSSQWPFPRHAVLRGDAGPARARLQLYFRPPFFSLGLRIIAQISRRTTPGVEDPADIDHFVDTARRPIGR
jgi:type II secretory pathway pseudopilin PulG